MSAPEPELGAFLVASGLATGDDEAVWTPLTGGVSSDIWKVEVGGRSICVKRARATLQVEAEWSVSTDRNAYEWAWMLEASRICPQATPELLAHDAALGVFAMAYLDPGDYPQWKQQLVDQRVDVAGAMGVGDRLGMLHAATADRTDIRAAFETTDLFTDLRLNPYFRATAERHPDLAGPLEALCVGTVDNRRALVHGDVSPKNILLGPSGPVFLDAECAWYGDPAFDLAFCLTHLLLGALDAPATTDHRLASVEALTGAYLKQVSWEPRDAVEQRAAALLPALMLARVDGKSPVEYLTSDEDKDTVRRVAGPRIAAPAARISAVAEAWRLELAARG